MNEIVFTKKDHFDNLTSFIKADKIKETSAIALCKESSNGSMKRFIVYQLMYPDKHELLNQSEIRVTFSPEFMDRVFDICVRNNLHPIDIHDHPFADSKVAFSPTDLFNQKDNVGPYINKYFNGMKFGFIVIGKDKLNIDANIWDRKKHRIEPVDKIKIIEKDRFRLIVPHSSSLSNIAPKNTSHRTMLAIGQDTQKTMSTLTILIVGAGGLGALAAEHFARLGVRKIIIVDPDVVTETNLNRLIGATFKDVTNKMKKVYVCKKLIKSIDRKIEVVSIDGDFLSKEVQDICKEADIGIGTVDNAGTRFSMNRFFQAHAIPYFDAGCGGKLENDNLTYAGGQVLKITPGGGFCIECQPFFSREKARIDLMSIEEQKAQASQGYIDGLNFPQASVYSWNSAVVSNLVWLVMRYISGDCPRVDGIANDFLNHRSWSWQEEIEQNANSKELQYCEFCHEAGNMGKGNEVPYLLRQKNTTFPLPTLNTDDKKTHLAKIVETLRNEVNRKLSLPLKEQFKEDIDLPEKIIRTFMYGKNIHEIELAMDFLTSQTDQEVDNDKGNHQKPETGK